MYDSFDITEETIRWSNANSDSSSGEDTEEFSFYFTQISVSQNESRPPHSAPLQDLLGQSLAGITDATRSILSVRVYYERSLDASLISQTLGSLVDSTKIVLIPTSRILGNRLVVSQITGFNE